MTCDDADSVRVEVGKVYAGTSGWAYATWKPDFYPAKLASAKFLGHYASRLNTVEVNYTFRRFPTEKLLRGWLTQVPEDFKFAFKANQKITHIKRLKDVAEFTAEFATALQPMGAEGRLGPVLFQLPPYLKCDAAVLREFLSWVPRGLKSAFEFRHASWFCDEVYDVMREGECGAVSGGEREAGDAGCADGGFRLFAIEERGLFGEGAGGGEGASGEVGERRGCVCVFQA